MILIFPLLALIVLLLVWFQWDAVELLTVFLMLPYYLLIGSIVIGMIVASVMVLFRNSQEETTLKRIFPLLVTVLLLLALWKIPFTELYLQWDFENNLDKRTGFIQMVEKFSLDFGKNRGQVELPTPYNKLSKGGDILIDLREGNVKILFFTFGGVLDNYSGFMYVSLDSEKEVRSFRIEGEFQEVRRIQPCWFWVASN